MADSGAITSDNVKQLKLFYKKVQAKIKAGKNSDVACKEAFEETFNKDEFIAAKALTNIKGDSEVTKAQELLKQTLPKIPPPAPHSSEEEKEINEAINNDNPNYGNMIKNLEDQEGLTRVSNIEENMKAVRISNAGNTFGVGKNLSNELINSAIATAKSQDKWNEADKKAQLREIIRQFWNNDPNGVQFFSMQELVAVQRWIKENDPELLKGFHKMFVESIQKDTKFSLQLIARQWAQLLGSSAFLEEVPADFKNFFNDLGKEIAKEAGKDLQGGAVIATYNGKAENGDFENVLIRKKDNDVEITMTTSGDDENKIKYDFSSNEPVKVKVKGEEAKPKKGVSPGLGSSPPTKEIKKPATPPAVAPAPTPTPAPAQPPAPPPPPAPAPATPQDASIALLQKIANLAINNRYRNPEIFIKAIRREDVPPSNEKLFKIVHQNNTLGYTNETYVVRSAGNGKIKVLLQDRTTGKEEEIKIGGLRKGLESEDLFYGAMMSVTTIEEFIDALDRLDKNKEFSTGEKFKFKEP